MSLFWSAPCACQQKDPGDNKRNVGKHRDRVKGGWPSVDNSPTEREESIICGLDAGRVGAWRNSPLTVSVSERNRKQDHQVERKNGYRRSRKKVPNRHLGESETEWSRQVFQLVSVPCYTHKKLLRILSSFCVWEFIYQHLTYWNFKTEKSLTYTQIYNIQQWHQQHVAWGKLHYTPVRKWEWEKANNVLILFLEI